MNDGRGGSPERLGRLVQGLLEEQGLAEGVERGAAITEWAEIVGPQIACVSKPVGFDRETLFVEVKSSAWLMELQLMERRILAQLNAARRRGKFRRIVFRLAGGT